MKLCADACADRPAAAERPLARPLYRAVERRRNGSLRLSARHERWRTRCAASQLDFCGGRRAGRSGRPGLCPGRRRAGAEAAEAVVAAVPDPGNTAWMLISTVLVLLMTVPGLALFYGGLVRAKNMLSVLMQVFTITCRRDDHLGRLRLQPGLHRRRLAEQLSSAASRSCSSPASTPGSRGRRPSRRASSSPNSSSSCFQMTFACITPALIVGAFAERIKFSAVLLFVVLWVTFVYFPIAHMVWFWGGPSAYADPSGLIFGFGAIDFAGGTVVHINAGIAGLVGAPHDRQAHRLSEGADAAALDDAHHGRRLAAVGRLVRLQRRLQPRGQRLRRARDDQHLRRHRRARRWPGRARRRRRAARPRCSARPPARWPASSRSPRRPASPARWARSCSASSPALVCYFFVAGREERARLRRQPRRLRHPLHRRHHRRARHRHPGQSGLGGAGIVDYSTADFAAGYAGTATQVWTQIKGVVVTLVWSGIGSAILYKIVDLIVGLRASAEAEREGLDLTSHGEVAYHT